MADTDVKLPGLGQVNKKALYLGGAAAAGIVGYLWYKNRSANAAAAASNTSDSTDTSGDTSSDIDPLTGFVYGSPQDEEALAAQNDGEGVADTGTGISGYVGPEYDGLYWDPSDDEYDLTSPYGTSTTTTTTTPTTNAEWEQDAIADLQAGGVSQSIITNAENGLPRYLAKLSLSSAQASAVQMAVGLAGEPPVGGPYSIITAPGSSGAGGTHKGVRQVATGTESLDQVAKQRNTSVGHIEAVTETPGIGINASNLAKFKNYVAKGTDKKMPKGLVYYTTN